MTKAKKAKATPATIGTVTNAGTLAAALVTLTGDAARMLGTVAFGAMYRTLSGGHVNKRGIFVASLVASLTGDGTLDTLRAAMRAYAVPALRAEVQYAVATGDVAYFRARTGEWCTWALGLVSGDALITDPTDDALYTAFERTCPTNPANVNGMVTEVTLAAQRRNVTPLPIFADVVATNAIAAYDPATHTAYAAKGYGHATFTLPA